MESQIGLVFDLDGTLIDSRADLAAAVNYARACKNLQALSVDTISSYIGNGIQKLLERSFLNHGEESSAAYNFEEAVENFDTYYNAHSCDLTIVYDGIHECLEEFASQGIGMSVVSNKPDQFIGPILQELKLASFFQFHVGGNTWKKPDPGGILYVLERMKLLGQNSWMIGDHDTDLQSGRAAGCKVAFCEWGFGHRDEAPIDAVCAEPRDWLQLVS